MKWPTRKFAAARSLTLCVALVALVAVGAAQEPAATSVRDAIRIRIGDSAMQFSFNGLGTHMYGGAEPGATARTAGEFKDGVYSCWLPDGKKVVEIAWDDGLVVTPFGDDGKPLTALRSKGLAPARHANGRRAFLASGGRFQFYDDQGAIAADVRLCQQLWQAFGADVEINDEEAWQELLYEQNVGMLLPRIIDGIKHVDPWIRAYACTAVRGFRRDAVIALPALRQALRDAHFWLVRHRAAEAVNDLGVAAAAAVPELIAILRDSKEHEPTRVAAAYALGGIGARAAVSVPALDEATRLGPPALQIVAIAALGWIDPSDRDTAQQLLRRLDDAAIGVQAADALAWLGPRAAAVRDAVQTRVAEAGGGEPSVFTWALANALFHIDPTAPQPAWFDRDLESPTIRVQQVEPEALFTFCLVDSDPDEIANALFWLADHDGYSANRLREFPMTLGPEAQAAAPGLVHLLEEYGAGPWAAAALARIGSPAIPALVAAVNAAHSRTPEQALAALQGMRAPAVPALAGILTHQHSDTRRQAAAALGSIGPAAKAALPALQKALGDADSEARQDIQVAIARIVGPTAGPPR